MKSSIISSTTILLLSTASAHAASSTKQQHYNLRKSIITEIENRNNRKNPRRLRGWQDIGRKQQQQQQQQQQQGTMKMVLFTDRYPAETSWKIIDNCAGDTVVMSGNNYKTPFTIYEDSKYLPSSQYSLEIKDAYGDGICCGQGQGSFHLSFNDEVVASGGQFGKSESQTWGSCQNLTDSPTASPTAAPTTCDMPYELILKTRSSSSISSDGPSWDFAYGQNRSRITADSSGIAPYSPGSTFREEGCLPRNCYRFQIKGGVETYSLFIDGKKVAEAKGEVTNSETSLFGTCGPI